MTHWESEIITDGKAGVKLKMKRQELIPPPVPESVLHTFNEAKPIPPTVMWGNFKGPNIALKLEAMYDRTVKWKPNFFKLPTGEKGKAFVAEMIRLIDMWTNKTSMESVSLLALQVIAPIMLQKPSRKSKNKDHIKYLGERLVKWKDGLFDELISECETIQKKLTQNSKLKSQDNVTKIFTKLMLQGKVAAALRWITGNNAKLLQVDKKVITQAVPPTVERLICGKPPKVEPVIYDEIDADLIFKSAKITHGSAGPSGIDADMWRRILCSASFGHLSEDIRDSVARMCRRLCTENVDPSSISALTNCRLIPLDKDPGIRPIGIGEVLRRIMGKAVVMLLKPEILDTVGPLQLSAGQEGGCEAACHAMADIFEEDDCQGVLLVDATNAYNSLNRTTALLNIRHTCPEFATYLINTYRRPAKLFLPGGEHITSNEGTTQGDNCASGFYSISTMLMIKELALISNTKQIWYADDGGAGGTLEGLRQWWDKIVQLGPDIGYFPNAGKTWLIIKPEFIIEAEVLFSGTGIKITSEGPEGGQRYLGAALGTPDFIQQYVKNKVKTWVDELEKLSETAKCEPQLAYSAYTTGLCKRWSYIMRTIPGISDLFEPLEECIKSRFLPALLGGYSFSERDRKIFGLPVRFGGLAIFNPTEVCQLEFDFSLTATAPLKSAILQQKLSLTPEESLQMSSTIKESKKNISFKKSAYYKEKVAEIKTDCSEDTARNLIILSLKGASSWLTVLPLQEFRYTLSKQEFVDAICLRYKFPIKGVPTTCACSKPNSIDHALSCSKGGYTDMRHNQIRNLEATFLREVCHDVQLEPKLLPLTGETFTLKSANTRPDARSDVSARGVWRTMDKTFLDVRIFHDGNKSNSGPIEKVFLSHEAEKKRVYNQRIIEVEKSYFTPLVFSTSGGMGIEAAKYHKRLATLISTKRGIPYSDAISHIRCKLRFSILKTTLTAVRGYRGTATKWGDGINSDINLIPQQRQFF
jgi:hypothetical protein